MDMAGALVLATSVMGLGAITFSALSLAFQRSHSRKSVRPFCNVLQRESENEMHISIQNAGMGPMRILKIVLLEHEGDSIQDGIPLEEAFSAEVASGVILHRLDGFVLAPLQEVELFRYTVNSASERAASRITSSLFGRYLAVTYLDIYDDAYEKKEALLLPESF